MLTKQTFLTQTGPGIKRPVLHFQRKIQEIQLESQSAGDLNSKKQRSAGKNPEISRNHKISERWIINQPNWGTEVHSRQKLSRKQLCYGRREIMRFLQGDHQSQLGNKSSLQRQELLKRTEYTSRI
jgi:hypothetical protein